MASISLPDLARPLSSVPYNQRWELLKPAIERLYLGEGKQLAEVAQVIQAHHGFPATEAQYKYQMKKWKIKKSTSTAKKAAICRVVKSRQQQGKTSVIRRGSKNFDVKNLQRYLKAESKKAITLQPAARAISGDPSCSMMSVNSFGNRIFMNWNMPYGITIPRAAMAVDHTSPISDIQVATPSSTVDAPSPMAVTIKEITALDRARLFVEGRHDELLQSMRGKQRAIMSTWMYQFWLFSFKTAKHWGKGPREWTAEMLGFGHPRPRPNVHSLPNTPGSANTPGSPSRLSIHDSDAANSGPLPTPTALCRWSIHCKPVAYERLPSPARSTTQEFDLDDEQDWPAWPEHLASTDIEEKLCDSLENNRFSNIECKNLPIKMNQVAGAARRSEKEIFKESVGFCIMSRNEELLDDLLYPRIERSIDIRDLDIFPFHLAASYLDGSKGCCTIFETLIDFFRGRRFYVNDLGHTVLDQLMITILKAHSSCSLDVVDNTINRGKRYEGEEVDTCGRWDADSNCVRQRQANEYASIPFDWKHMFCHTSVQAICHCIVVLLASQEARDANTLSGLFVRYCTHCGLKLQLLPLHTLVLVGYQLTLVGCEGETLFGIVACLLCLLTNGHDPSEKVQISLESLLGDCEDDECSHRQMGPCELALNIFNKHNRPLPERLTNAWQVIIHILQHSQAEWQISRLEQPLTQHDNNHADTYIDYDKAMLDSESDLPVDDTLPHYCFECTKSLNFFGQSPILAPLWAAIQTELLTYRRQEEGDPWISQNFNIKSLAQGLIHNGKVDIRLVQQDMMKDFCPCGKFVEAMPAYAIVEDATTHYFSNMDDWNRSSYLETCAIGREDWCF